MPKPNSALSSKSEFAHAGPRPCAFCVYGVVGRLPPKIEERFLPAATPPAPGVRLVYRPALLGVATLHYAQAKLDVDVSGIRR